MHKMDEIIDREPYEQPNRNKKRAVEKAAGVSMEELIDSIRARIHKTLHHKANRSDSKRAR